MMFRPSVAAALLIAASSTARAQAPHIYCPPGALSCFAMKTQFTYDPGNATLFTVWLQNLQGTFNPDPTPFSLQTFWIARNNGPAVAPNGLPEYYLTVEANQNQNMSPDPFPAVEGGAQAGTGTLVDRFDCADIVCTNAFFDFVWFGIVGCDLPAIDPSLDPTAFFAVRTCPAQGIGGWARMDFWLTLHDGVDLSEPPIDVDADMFVFGVGGEDQAHACFFGGDQAGLGDSIPHCTALPYVLPTVSPEPATLALVGSGLLGVIGIGWRRRRSA